MENSFANHVLEWKEMNKQGQFVETRHFYFEKLFQEEIDQFVQRTKWQRKPVDVLFSLLGYTPEPIILAEKVLNPRKHVILHDREVTYNEDNLRYLPRFLDEGFTRIELPDESFASIYETLKQQMAFNPGSDYTINITGGKNQWWHRQPLSGEFSMHP